MRRSSKVFHADDYLPAANVETRYEAMKLIDDPLNQTLDILEAKISEALEKGANKVVAVLYDLDQSYLDEGPTAERVVELLNDYSQPGSVVIVYVSEVRITSKRYKPPRRGDELTPEFLPCVDSR